MTEKVTIVLKLTRKIQKDGRIALPKIFWEQIQAKPEDEITIETLEMYGRRFIVISKNGMAEFLSEVVNRQNGS